MKADQKTLQLLRLTRAPKILKLWRTTTMKDKLLAHSKKLLTLLSETAQSLRMPPYMLRVMMTVTLLLGEHGGGRQEEGPEKERETW